MGSLRDSEVMTEGTSGELEAAKADIPYKDPVIRPLCPAAWLPGGPQQPPRPIANTAGTLPGKRGAARIPHSQPASSGSRGPSLKPPEGGKQGQSQYP